MVVHVADMLPHLLMSIILQLLVYYVSLWLLVVLLL